MLPAPADLDGVLGYYQHSFQHKVHRDEPGPSDALMEVFGLTPAVKAQAAQYWGRELGLCWERLVRQTYLNEVPDVGGALKSLRGSPCDFTAGAVAIDTKYRLGSGDAGTLGKLAGNARWLEQQGYRPVMLILRDDSLPSALSRMRNAGWHVFEGRQTLHYVQEATGQDLGAYLAANKGRWGVETSTKEEGPLPDGRRA